MNGNWMGSCVRKFHQLLEAINNVKANERNMFVMPNIDKKNENKQEFR